MFYINKTTKEYPITELDIREKYPTTIFPVVFVPPDEYDIVRTTPKPEYNKLTQIVREIQPKLIKGVYYQEWEVVDLDIETIEVLRKNEEERIKTNAVVLTQQRLDDFARTRNYDNILSACTYATSTVNKFQQEGQRAVDLRDLSWAKLYEILEEVESGIRPLPQSFEEIEKELPVLSW